MTRLNSTGDTIVEVLLSITIVSFVLAGAFAVVSSNSKMVRTSEEHGQLLMLAQGQVEKVRELAVAATSDTDPIFTTSGKFCVDSDSNILKIGTAEYTAKCSGIDSLYTLAVNYDTSSQLFRIQGSGASLTGSNNSVELYYRVHPGSVIVAASPVAPAGGGSPGGGSVTPAGSSTPPSALSDGSADLTFRQPADSGSSSTTASSTTPCYVRNGWNNLGCWRPTLVNNSDNPAGKVAKCTFSWGDGTSETHSGSESVCQYGNTIPHQYNVQPEGAGPEGGRYRYYVTITNIMADGSPTKSKTISFLLPG